MATRSRRGFRRTQRQAPAAPACIARRIAYDALRAAGAHAR
jgi:hypothetical protein